MAPRCCPQLVLLGPRWHQGWVAAAWRRLRPGLRIQHRAGSGRGGAAARGTRQRREERVCATSVLEGRQQAVALNLAVGWSDEPQLEPVCLDQEVGWMRALHVAHAMWCAGGGLRIGWLLVCPEDSARWSWWGWNIEAWRSVHVHKYGMLLLPCEAHVTQRGGGCNVTGRLFTLWWWPCHLQAGATFHGNMLAVQEHASSAGGTGACCNVAEEIASTPGDAVTLLFARARAFVHVLPASTGQEGDRKTRHEENGGRNKPTSALAHELGTQRMEILKSISRTTSA
ncbi:hypothetical protein HaLaN_09899 [Haematococcus lacustris]|uniref:Uncharacterized protein n=1 Tax=Haematococcus lacustris TaxID=44745 RepID=A0A699ZEG6_HAELA|nr:hypothetical protein HaLaN_09899 [Haematococcus lacustris]